MKSSASRENILKKIRQALHLPVPVPFPGAEGPSDFLSEASDSDPAIAFATAFTHLGGRFVYCATGAEMIDQFRQLAEEKKWDTIYCAEDMVKGMFQHYGFNRFTDQPLAVSQVAITSCEALVARTGSIVLSSHAREGRTASVYAPVHICIAYAGQLCADIKDALRLLQQRYGNDLPSFISFATGPSRTADIEKTLVVGVHGPKEVYCFLIEN